MSATIKLNDFDNHRPAYQKLRLGLLDHQPSAVRANELDLNMFSMFFHDNGHQNITGLTILDALTWFR